MTGLGAACGAAYGTVVMLLFVVVGAQFSYLSLVLLGLFYRLIAGALAGFALGVVHGLTIAFVLRAHPAPGDAPSIRIRRSTRAANVINLALTLAFCIWLSIIEPYGGLLLFLAIPIGLAWASSVRVDRRVTRRFVEGTSNTRNLSDERTVQTTVS